MATNIIKTQIQFRRDTTENWYLNRDVVPAVGEPCFDFELGTLKIGDGVTTYEHLEPIGAKIEVDADGKSIVLENGIFELAGFDAAQVGAQPRKSSNGNIEWVLPSVDSVDGLQSAVAGLQSDVKSLQDIVTPSGEGAQPLLTRVETLEGKVNVLNGTENTEGSILKIVKDEINAFATKITDGETIDTFKELVDYVADHGDVAATMAADIASLQELVGEDSVEYQISQAISDASKIETIKVGNTLLDIVEKTVTIPVGAGLKASDEIGIAEDGTLNIKTVSFDKIVQNEGDTVIMDGGSAV